MNYKPVIVGNQSNGNADQEKEDNVNITNNVNAAGTNGVNVVGENTNNELPFDLEMPELEDISTFNSSNKDEDDEHPLDQVIGDQHSTTLTRNMSKNLEEHRAIGTKCVFKNKRDKRGIMIRNKARLVAQGHSQEEGIDYNVVFALVARIEAIRLFLAYASFKDFMVYQIDVKSAFLYGKIEEEVYVYQPIGFEDPDSPEKVYKVEKALYGLHQALRACYETLSTYLSNNDYHRGKIDKTLFIRRQKDDILLVQVYVDDIIFGSTKKELCNAFEKMMHEKFQMKVENASTPMETQKPLLKFEDEEEVDVHMYSTIASTVIYLATYQKFNFPKYIFESMVKNLDSVTKFLMYPRKRFSGRVTPLFPTMMVQAQKEMGKESVADEAVNEDMDNRLVRAATITSRLEVEQASGGGLRRQDTMGDAVTQTKSERVSKISNDPLLNRVLALEATKTTQAQDIDSLNRRVKKLKKKKRSRTHKLIRLYKVVLSARVESFDDEGLGKEDASKQGRIIDDLDADEDITLVNDQEMSNADKDLQGEEVVVEQEVVADKEPIVDATQIRVSRKLQEEINKKERLVGERAKQKEEANIALIETWEDIQAKVDKLAERLQAEEQQELNEEKKAKLFMELLEKRRKFFDTKRAEEKRNRPPIKA
nr:putative ribonuclease H-like domain-containing protein [Tanacetum cinerariifolium]